MKLHLPSKLYRAVLACMAVCLSFSLASSSIGYAAGDVGLKLMSEQEGLDTLTWWPSDDMTWDLTSRNWSILGVSGYEYTDGSIVQFCDTGSGEVVLEGSLSPRSVVVDNGQGHDYMFGGSGSLTGNMTLTKDGAGTLTINTANDYRGVTVLNAGMLVAGSDTAFGSGALLFKGGVLDLGGFGISNALCAEIADIVVRNGSLNGDFTVTGGSVDAEGLHIQNRNAEVQGAAEVSFRNAFSLSNGGAIYSSGTLELNNNGHVEFSRNSTAFSELYVSSLDGGAIYACGTLNLTCNDCVEFNGNYTIAAWSRGGAIYACGSLMINNNGRVDFRGNSALGDASIGGAIYVNSLSDGGGTLNLTCNDSVEFRENTTSYSGGAIYANCSPSDAASMLSLTDNGRVSFMANSTINTSSSSGGAIYACGSLNITGNGYVEFSGNFAAGAYSFGGAICAYRTLTITNNDIVEFSGNSASGDCSFGGAIYAYHTLNVVGNQQVLFSGNYESTNEGSDTMYRMRSVYMVGDKLILAAGAGQDITFYDSFYVENGYSYGDAPVTVSFNDKYCDKDNVERAATGDIVFSGAHTAENLAKLKPNYTAQELTDSLTSEVYAESHLYGGRLRIEDGAIYKGNGIAVASGSGAVLRLSGGSLDQTGYDVVLGAGSMLELLGANSITANMLDMQAGSVLSFVLNDAMQSEAVLSLNGEFCQGGELDIHLTGDVLAHGKRAKLIELSGGVTPETWDASMVSVSGMELCHGYLNWDEGTLYMECVDSVEWDGSASMTWNTTDANWHANNIQGFRYLEGDNVSFKDTGSGAVSLEGTLSPGSVLVENTEGHDYTFTGSGRLAGKMQLTKAGAGMLTISTANSYTGGTVIQGGSVELTNLQALGLGGVELQGGTLNLAGLSVNNDVSVTGAAVFNGGNRYLGKLVLNGGALSGTALQLAQDAIVRSGSIANNLTGQGGMLKTGSGLVELSGLNSYSGTTTIEEGTLKISGMVTGNLSVNGGTLNTANGMTLAYGQRVTLNGGNVAGNLSTREGSSLVVLTGVTLDGDLTFNGGTVSFANAGPDAYLAITGALNIQSGTQMKLSGYDEAGTYYLASFGIMTGSLGDISLSSTFPAGGRQQAILTDAGNYLLLTVTGDAATLNWAGGSGTWAVGNGTKWTSTDVTDTKFYTNDTVVFSKGGTVTISGEVAPKEMNVSGTSATVFKGTGSIVGEATLTKDGTGALTLNASNAYTGGTIINDGTVNASGAASFGENGILLNGGKLDMKTYAVENGVTAYGGTISGSAYNGALSVLGAVTVSGTLAANSIDLKEGSLSGGSIKDAMIYAHSGSIGSDITGESELDVDGDVVFTGTADHTLGTYVNSGTFTLAGSMSSDIVLLGGTLKTEDLQLGEWQLLEFSGGNVQGNVTAGENALLNLYTDSTIDGNLKLNGALVEMNNATLKVTGKLMVEIGSLDAQGGIEAREVQLGADAIMEVRDFSGETAYTVRSVEGESSYAQGVTFTADAITGSGDTPALIEHSVIKLEEGVKVEMSNVVLSADSMLLDDPATVVANRLVLEGLNGCNVAEGTPQTIKSGSILKRLGEPSELIELDEDAQACRFDLTNIENVHLEGNCLTIDLSGMYPTLKEYCELYDWIGISLGSGDRAATIDDSLVVELKIQPNQTEPGYVGWGGTFVTVPANGENVGPVVYFRMSAVPEPSSSTLSLLALAALVGCRRRK